MSTFTKDDMEVINKLSADEVVKARKDLLRDGNFFVMSPHAIALGTVKFGVEAAGWLLAPPQQAELAQVIERLIILTSDASLTVVVEDIDRRLAEPDNPDDVFDVGYRCGLSQLRALIVRGTPHANA
jgi:hypothetical protein